MGRPGVRTAAGRRRTGCRRRDGRRVELEIRSVATDCANDVARLASLGVDALNEREIEVCYRSEQRLEVCARAIGDAHRRPHFPRGAASVRASQPLVSVQATISPVARSSTCAPPPKALTCGREQVLAHWKRQRQQKVVNITGKRYV
jgi:hypothetical protein